jgi:micrococcal nuclease
MTFFVVFCRSKMVGVSLLMEENRNKSFTDIISTLRRILFICLTKLKGGNTLKFIRWAIFAFIALFLLALVSLSPWSLIGIAVFAYGVYQLNKKRHGQNNISKPGWVTAGGLILAFFLAVAFVEPVEETSTDSTKTENQLATEQQKKQEELEKKEKVLEEREKELAAKEKVLEETTKEEQAAKQDAVPVKAVDSKEQSASALPAGLIAATVNRVVDGDTIKIDLDGQEETIRLILVDTPETKHPKTGVQPFGPEASAFTTEQLTGKSIKIEPGIEERDRYGRLLAYVYVGDKMFNKMLLEKGLARVAIYPPNTKYLDEFEKLQAAAKEKKIGIWSIENYATDDGYNTESKEESAPAPAQEEPKPEPQPAPEPEPVVETPVVQSESYQNCTALRSVYPDGVASDHPAYESKHDRDKDNWACER